MRIVIEIPETKYLSLKKCLENGITLGMTDIAVLNGTLLPEGAEILTKEAYSDLCLRASNGSKTGRWIGGGYWSEGCGMGETYGYYYKCSECGTEVKGGYIECGYNFCHKCGAKMEGEEE